MDWAKRIQMGRIIGRRFRQFHADLENQNTEPIAGGIVRQLQAWKEQFEAGESLALFKTIEICVRYRMLTPAWAAKAFQEGLERVEYAEVASWDKAFGRPYPKGKHLAQLRRRFELNDVIYIHIRRILDWCPGDPPVANWLTKKASVDDELFEAVGKEFGIGPHLCKDLYYEQKKRLDPIFPKSPFSANF